MEQQLDKLDVTNVLEHRKAFHKVYNADSSRLKEYVEKCKTTFVTIEPSECAGMNQAIDVHIHKPDTLPTDEAGPALIYFHDGSFVFWNSKETSPIACHHAVNFNCTVFGVDYGVAPEIKAPLVGRNAYEAVKYIVENAKQFNIDPTRIAIGG